MNEILQQLFDTWTELRKCGLNAAYLETGVNIACLLVRDRKFLQLRTFLEDLTSDENACLHGNERFLKSKLLLFRHEGKHDDVVRLIKNGTYRYPSGLLELWDQSHYYLEETEGGKPLTNLGKFRVRQRHPPPQSICPSGKRLFRRHAQCSVNKLRSWLDQHRQMPYPTREEEDILICASGLSKKQVKRWFANARRRLRKEVKSRREIHHPMTPNINRPLKSTNLPSMKSINIDQNKTQICPHPTEQSTVKTRGAAVKPEQVKPVFQNGQKSHLCAMLLTHDTKSDILTSTQRFKHDNVAVTTVTPSTNAEIYQQHPILNYLWDSQLSSNSIPTLHEGLQCLIPATENAYSSHFYYHYDTFKYQHVLYKHTELSLPRAFDDL